MGTVSLSNDFYLSAGDVVKAALRKIGILGQGQEPTTSQMTESLAALNSMVMSWQAYGVNLWKVDTIPFTTTSGTDHVTLYDSCIGVEHAYLRIDSIDYPLNRLSIDEYVNRVNRSDTSAAAQPTDFHVRRYIDASNNAISDAVCTLFLYPIPDDAYTLYVRMYLRTYDNDTSTNQVDFLPEWSEALIYGLAYRLAPEYMIPLDERKILAAEAASMWKIAHEGTNRDTGSVFIAPYVRY